MKKYMKLAILVLITAVVLGVVVWGSGILYAAYSKMTPQVPQLARLEPAETVAVGSDVQLSFRVKLPADRSIVSAQLAKSADVAVVRELSWKREKWLWNSNIWQFYAMLRPLAAGEISEGAITLAISPEHGRRDAENFTIAVPAFTSRIPDGEKAGSELTLAGAMVEPGRTRTALFRHLLRYKYVYTAAALLLAVVIFLIVRHILKRKVEIPADCWDVALAALESLTGQIRRGDILPRAGYNELMDILRNYLELRFNVPASRRTTEEFLAALSRFDSPLPEHYRDKFGVFLSSADQIRFAKAPVNVKEFDFAAGQLSDFIRATIPVEAMQ